MWGVVDYDWNAFDDCLSVGCWFEELGKGLETAEEADKVVSIELPFAILAYNQGVLLVDKVGGNGLRDVADDDEKGDILERDGLTLEDGRVVERDDLLDSLRDGGLDGVVDFTGGNCQIRVLGNRGDGGRQGP